ncbi:gliding motility-associated lipoprotein GldH [Lewinella marina]|uniref:Gliding motility lipoprotein GldH n=1 Tax=Neolewinella marina TaxID=438751 RepID=A0A2G0CIY6_9BACT|nr:gliding motility lipoprotein GldH [Neolewinella marina]NJB84960.1 gliding motility-associated lipoprotein GldH [Neolewinella marina]PHK99887.1 hypothetical protein CGL56_02255 [Neolewinella marina]
MSLRLTTGLPLLLALLSACGPEITFQEESDLGPAGWAYADSVAFTFPVTDTSARYDLVLSVTHTQDFPFQNFYTRLATHLPDGTVLTQPLSLQLADTFGDWYGECSGTECTADISLQTGTRFTQLGEHRLVVAQFSRQDPLEEVTGIGFRIVKREE